MNIIEKILNSPIDEDVARELAGPQEEMTRKTSEVLGTMGPVNIAHVVMLVNTHTGITTISSNLKPDFLIRLLRDTVELLEKGR